MATFDTNDLAEYLVEATDGMEREDVWLIGGGGGADASKVVYTLHSIEARVCS